MTDQAKPRTTADWIVDLCVYAPIGFALDAYKYVPEFADRGRNQVALARVLGKFALGRLEQQLGPLGSLLRTPSADPPPSAPTAPPPAAPPAAPAATRPATPATAPDASAGAPPAPPATKAAAPRPRAKRVEPKPSARPTPRTSANGRTARSGASPAVVPAAASEPLVAAPPAEASLAIEGYATLAASQIVPRLTTLSRADLEAIDAFERANRGRRTILHRVEQLLAER